MTALQLPTDGFGYGPARAARLESDLALRRALPLSFMLIAGLMLVASIAQRLVPISAIVVDAGPVNEHWMVPPGMIPPTSGQPVFRPAPPIASTSPVPLPVPDAIAPATEPDAEANARDGDGPIVNAGRAAGEAGRGLAPDADPQPGEWVLADQLPERVLYVAPEYTDLAREAGVEGTVLMWALVDLDGSVKDVRVIGSVPLLDAAASTALRRWRFTPALANGHPVRVWLAVPVRFTLR